MADDTPQVPEVANLRYLKWLVTVLTVTMIGGVLTIVAVLVMAYGEIRSIDLPDGIALPDGVSATAFTQGEGWFAVVTDGDEVLIFSRITGELRQRIPISLE
ncbi:MAG: DUF6476 family protein [Pseudomonadota bacterium]